MMEHSEHVQTRNYGCKGRITKALEAGLPFRTILARDIRDVRRITGKKYNEGLKDALEYYRKNLPELINKKR